jgi:hypothetical protein
MRKKAQGSRGTEAKKKGMELLGSIPLITLASG